LQQTRATVIPGGWMTTVEAAERLGKSERTVQEMGRDGRLRSKQGVRPDQPRARFYNAEDVERYLTAKPEPSPDSLARREATHKAKQLAPMPAKRELAKVQAQSERALDTVSIVGQIMVSHKAELQTLVDLHTRSLETVVNLILSAQKAEADANRERLKAEREDARERWEIERRDRLERRVSRTMAAKAGA
jgi:excisionase family DNA binding protein